MKLRELIDLTQKHPEFLDYTLNLSQYMRIPKEVDEEMQEDMFVVVDFPIRAILSSEESQEIRFALYHSDFKDFKMDEVIHEVEPDDQN